MKNNSTIKKLLITVSFPLLIFFIWRIFFEQKRVLGSSDQAKIIRLNDNGIAENLETNANSIEEFFSSQNILINDGDVVYPDRNTKLFSGETVNIQRIKKLSVTADKSESEIKGFGETIGEILKENNIQFKDEDIITPERDSFAYNGEHIKIIRVEIKEEVKEKPIDFKIIEKEDDQLSWRIKKVSQKGVRGVKEIKYEVAYQDGKEVSRKIVGTNVTKDPIDETITQGTYVKLGKSHSGQASWYAYTGTMAAANPWLPIGSYVKVTNQDNRKSVIVKINDRGPFGKGRIIDLDKVAFEKIASLGQGIANIKMEEIVN